MTALSVFHPTDLSDDSNLALAHALRVVLAGDTRLTIAHVDDAKHGPTEFDEFPSVRQVLARWEILEPGSPRSALREQLGIALDKVELVGGDTVRAMSSYLDSHPAHLIVVATHGRDGWPRWLEGSVAEELARKTGAMTLFVPHHTRGFVSPDDGTISLKHVLVPYDTRPSPQPAVDAALALARAFGIQGLTITLCHVGQDTAEVVVPPHDGEVHVVLREGPVAEALVAVAEERAVDLIVMTTRAVKGDLFTALRGSHTEQVVRHAPCPVLAVPYGRVA